MIPKLKISAFVMKRLSNVKQQCSGCLFGVFYGEGTLLIMGFNVETTIGHLNYEQIQHQFPAELDLCGLVKFGDCSDSEAHLHEILQDVDITDNPILLQCEIGTLVGLRASIFMHGKLNDVPYEVMEAEQLYSDFCFTRLRCSLNIYADQKPQAIRKELHALRIALSGGSLAFKVDPTLIYITNASTHGSSSDNSALNITNESLISDIVHAIADAINTVDKENSGGTERDRKKKSSAGDFALSSIYGAMGCDYDVLNINVLRCKTRDRTTADVTAGNSFFSSLPAVSMCMRREELKLCIPIEIESMAMLSKSTKVSRLYDILIESICRSLRLFEKSLNENSSESLDAQSMVPQAFHFYPQDLGHFLSCAYLIGVSDNDSNMKDKRKLLHRHFGLPVTRPYFRRSNRCIFRSDIPSEAPLLNTHIGLRASGVVDGKQSLVQGNYYYYHYLQNQVQDKGWGCAYRSLQTICSWFLLQGYTDRPVPTHLEIQQYLVKIGDKSEAFLNSTQWIGSTEVAMCLEGFLQIESKILHVSSGSSLATLAADLSVHFQTQGTPVMIGGGVLAHTIIGVDYSFEHNQMKFLVLDPHYTGADELHTIQTKGWCGWKGLDFWDKKHYYNLCLPQRPTLF